MGCTQLNWSHQPHRSAISRSYTETVDKGIMRRRNVFLLYESHGRRLDSASNTVVAKHLGIGLEKNCKMSDQVIWNPYEEHAKIQQLLLQPIRLTESHNPLKSGHITSRSSIEAGFHLSQSSHKCSCIKCE